MNNARKQFLPSLLLSFVFVLVLSNLAYQIGNAMSIRSYSFGSQTSDFSYVCIPAKGRSLEEMTSSMEQYDSMNGTHTVLCRKFAKNYLQFWKWYFYLVYEDAHYDYPKCSK